MRMTLRLVISSLVLLLAGVVSAPAQTFQVYADSAALSSDGTMSTIDAHCIVQRSSEIVLFNSEDGAIYSNDGSSTTVLRDSSNLNGDIAAESNAIDRCDGVDIDADGNVYFLFRSDTSSETNSHTSYVYKLPASGSPSVLATEDGLKGVEVMDDTVYLSAVAFRGAPEDGFYSIASTGTEQSLTTVATDPELDLSKFLEVDSNGDLYSFSGEFGGGDKANVLMQVTDPAGSASIDIWADPYAGPFVNPQGNGGDGIDDMEIVQRDGSDRYYVYNESFTASDGEQFGVYQAGGASPTIIANETNIADATGSEITGGFTEPMVATATGEIFFASRDAFGGRDEIIQMGSVPLPVELASFDAVRTGSSVALTWQTASETNNAGFRVQHETDAGTWAKLGFVQSKASGGTTTDAQSYRFSVDQDLEAGTHRFRLEQVDLDGSTHLSSVVAAEVEMDRALILSAPAPNPASGQTSLSFAVKTETDARVAVYNVLGQKVTTLYRGTPQTGTAKTITFDTESLPSGVYLVRMEAGGQTRTQRLTVVR